MTEEEGQALERAYQEAVIGKYPPNLSFVPGALLNKHMKTEKYMPDRLYVVSKNGITLYTPEEDT